MLDDLREAARSLPACIVSSALICWGFTGSPGVGLVLGTIAAGARVGPVAGGVFAACGLLLGGFIGPIVWAPENLALLIVGAALGAVELWRSRQRWLISVVILGGLAAYEPTRVWALGIVVGMIGGRLALPERVEVWALRAFVAATVVGATLSVNHGFARAGNPSGRALLVGWGADGELLAPGQESAFWTWGRTPVFRALPGGPTFDVVPTGLTLKHSGNTAVDRAEVGDVDCQALLPDALTGERRAAVQAAKAGCSPLDELATDPFVDAARVLGGQPAHDAAAIHSVELAEPLDAPSAVVLAARARLENPRPAAMQLVDGSPYDRAVLLAELGPDDLNAIEELIATWASELPETVRGPYDRALDALAAPTARPGR
ncbi:MAG: hypothetical protein GY913_13350 [Proteobacteria bacterium]|nr:hypothetical protein [Pseudomonadota bacterium]